MKDYGLGYFNSFLLAILVYMGLLYFFFLKLSEYNENLKYTDIADSFINIELGQGMPNLLQASEPKQEQKPNLNETVVQKTTPQNIQTKEKEQEANDFNALFGNVKDFQEEQSDRVQSPARSAQNSSNLQSALELSRSLELKEQKELQVGENIQSQMTGVYDEFLGKVRRILEQRWRLFEKSGNFQSIVTYSIDSNGKFDYTLIEKSYNESFDTKVVNFLNALKGKFIAYPPNDQPYNGKVILSDEINLGVPI